jgi:hypothetical protein
MDYLFPGSPLSAADAAAFLNGVIFPKKWKALPTTSSTILYK